MNLSTMEECKSPMCKSMSESGPTFRDIENRLQLTVHFLRFEVDVSSDSKYQHKTNQRIQRRRTLTKTEGHLSGRVLP